MEFSDPTDLITLWDLSESFKHALRSRYAVKTWNRMRRAAGKAFRSTRPTPQEFEVLRYALEEGCEVCNAREAPRQWHWGSRICAGCLPSKVVTRRQFRQEHGDLFKSLPGAVKKIRWFNPAEVPGLEYTQIAVNSLNPVNLENPDDVAFRDWVDAGVQAVHDVMRAKPNGSQSSIATDVEGLISGERRWAETTSELRWSQEDNPWEVERLGPKRSQQITSMLLDMRGLKFKREDIPGPEDHLWHAAAYKGTEFTLKEWESIKGPLVRAVKRRRDERLALVLQEHIPPTPSSVETPDFKSHEDIAGTAVGSLPAAVFLEICTNLDLETVSAVEKTSKRARLILQSRAADHVWQTIRLSVGLTASFEGWPEREFLSYALRRVCSDCGKEGLHLFRFVSILCGDCFQFKVRRADAVGGEIPRAAVRAMVSLPAQPFIDSSWIDPTRNPGNLLHTKYLNSVAEWLKSLPKSLKQSLPNELLEKHIKSCSVLFLKVVEECERWQRARDPDETLMAQRREVWILQAVSSSWLGVTVEAAREYPQWNAIINRTYPCSNREWHNIRQPILDVMSRT